MDSIFIWAQMVGVVAMAVGVLGWRLQSPKNMSLSFALCDFIWAVQYLLLSAPVGCVLFFACAIRNYLSAYMEEAVMRFVIGIYLVLALGVSIYNYEHVIDVVPFIGTIAFSYGLLKKDRSILSRAGLFSNLCWTSYAIFYLSIPGLIYGIIIAVTQISSMIKYEQWSIGKCYKTFLPSISRALFFFQGPRTYP